MAKSKEQREAERLAREAQKAQGESSVARGDKSEQIEALNREATLHPDLVKSAHGEQMKVGHAGDKVFVGCKIGIAFLDLQLSRLEDVAEQTQTGIRTVKQARRYGPVVRIRGTAYPRGTVPRGYPAAPEIVAGCAITPNVDKDFMIEWMKANAFNPVVINDMVFFRDSDQDLRARARELAGILSGFEPINTEKGRDPRMPRPTNKDLSELEPTKVE